MSSKPFKFKFFSIIQDTAAMKVGTDGVLLGAWANCEKASSILDIGTGTGLIALMLAQKSEALIDAVEIDKEASTEACQNFLNSPWTDRLSVHNLSIQEFSTTASKKYDVIVSNPPFFINSQKANTAARTNARHNDMLSIIDLLNCVNSLLSETGRFYVVLPVENEESFNKIASVLGLFCGEKLCVKPTPTHAPKRVLLEYSKQRKSIFENMLTIESNGRHQYSDAYKELCKDYYLKF